MGFYLCLWLLVRQCNTAKSLNHLLTKNCLFLKYHYHHIQMAKMAKQAERDQILDRLNNNKTKIMKKINLIINTRSGPTKSSRARPDR